MAQRSSGFWEKARRSQQWLVEKYLSHPDVSMIDIGYPDEAGNSEQIVLRIHVRDSWYATDPQQRMAFPEQVDGIPVRVVRGEYRTDE